MASILSSVAGLCFGFGVISSLGAASHKEKEEYRSGYEALKLAAIAFAAAALLGQLALWLK